MEVYQILSSVIQRVQHSPPTPPFTAPSRVLSWRRPLSGMPFTSSDARRAPKTNTAFRCAAVRVSGAVPVFVWKASVWAWRGEGRAPSAAAPGANFGISLFGCYVQGQVFRFGRSGTERGRIECQRTQDSEVIWNRVEGWRPQREREKKKSSKSCTDA